MTFFHKQQKLSGTTKENHSKPINETMTDESNDVIFVDEPGPKSFKHLFSHDKTKSDSKKSTTPPPQDDLDQEHDKHKDPFKSKTDGNGANKRTDWDMFAEQDIDSNFDVRNIQLLFIVHSISCIFSSTFNN